MTEDFWTWKNWQYHTSMCCCIPVGSDNCLNLFLIHHGAYLNIMWVCNVDCLWFGLKTHCPNMFCLAYHNKKTSASVLSLLIAICSYFDHRILMLSVCNFIWLSALLYELLNSVKFVTFNLATFLTVTPFLKPPATKIFWSSRM